MRGKRGGRLQAGRTGVMLRGVVLGGAAILLSACGAEDPSETQGAPPPAVTVVQLKTEPVTETREFVGRVTAAERVEILARVRGFLEERLFVEGETVTAGEPLFRIESDAYEAAFAQREADLERARAEYENAQAQLRRGEELLVNNDIARARVDELRAAESVARAGIAQAEAVLQEARLNLEYTEISAPIDGRIGLSRYTVGNLVGPEAGALATVVQRDPIDVQLPLPQQELLEYRRAVLDRGGDPAAVTVHLRLADGSRYGEDGQVDFVDVTVDPGTDSVLVRSRLPNPDGLLVPGQFATVILEIGEPQTALLVPQSSLQMDQMGLFVLVVDDQQQVAVRRVTTGQQVDGRVVVQSGLSEGDRVVVEGVQKVRPGQSVTATPWQPPTSD
ncbi:efflux RND transporter periplasmic adaptor subunit [Thioalkalivibrio sp.]|uniref:efflux RND transporter periplasmic adaptor subunit n=1 Tax=Thioalkalivibrio sp. TaxID=2093813 RepID=UPI0035652F57